MTTLASLSVSLEANIVRFSEAMDRAAAVAEKNLSAIERSAGRMAKTLAGLGGLAVAGGILKMAKDALDAADAMGEAAERASISVEQFSALAYAAKQSDVPMASLEQSVKKLSEAMAEASRGNDKFTSLFATLGVKVTDANGSMRDTNKVLYDVANAFSRAKDGAGKVAFAIELLGKSGADAIPLLNKGAGAIRQLEEEGRALGATFTTESAEAASKFNKDLEKLRGTGGALAQTLTGSLVPGLSQVAEAMIEAKRQSGVLMSLWVGLGGIGNMIIGDGLEDDIGRLNRLGNEIEALGLQIEQMRKAGFQSEFLQPEIDRLKELIDLGSKLEGQMRAGERIRMNRNGLYNDARDQRLLPQNMELRLPSGRDTEAEKYARTLQALYDRLDNTGAGVNQKFWAELKMLEEQFGKNKMSVEQYIARVEELTRQTDYGKEITKRQTEAAKLANDEAQRAIDLDNERQTTLNASIRSLREYVEDLEFETHLMGLSNAEREVAIRLRMAEKAGIDTSTASFASLIDRIRSTINAQEAIRNQVSVWNQLADAVAGFAQSLMGGAKSAIDYLRQLLKQLLAEMIAIFAKRWILSLGASMTSGVASAALSTAAGTAGQGTLAGSLTSGIGSWLGSTAFGQAGSAFWTGLQGTELLAGGTQFEMVANQFGSALGAASGPLLIFAAAVVAGSPQCSCGSRDGAAIRLGCRVMATLAAACIPWWGDPRPAWLVGWDFRIAMRIPWRASRSSRACGATAPPTPTRSASPAISPAPASMR
jgi:hypothetical protein